MSKMQIFNTTDNKHLGESFEDGDNPIVLSDCEVLVENTINISADKKRYHNSNYIIDAQEEA